MWLGAKDISIQLPAWRTTTMPALKPRAVITSTVALFVSIVIMASFLSPAPLRKALSKFKSHVNSSPSSARPNISEDARNTTLGFHKVFYISLPVRTDRQDAMTLLSNFAGIDTTHVEGVDGKAIAQGGKGIGSSLNPGRFGCWRSHANVWRKMITEDVATALILEDDVDFDVDIKDQMFRISQGIQEGPNLINNDPKAPIDSSAPYGAGWDLLFLGLCEHTSRDSAGPDVTPHVSFEDPSVLDQHRLDSTFRAEFDKFGMKSNQTRLLVPLHDFYCTQGYAVSQQGAKRLLYHLGYKDVQAPVDLAMGSLVQAGALRGIAPIPFLFSQFKLGNAIDSNIDEGKPIGTGGVDKEKGHSWGIKSSARTALKQWIKWEDPEPKPRPKQKREGGAGS